MGFLKRYWAQSIPFRISATLGAVMVAALAVVAVAAYLTEQASGKASAINVAGSLRMQSYALALRVHSIETAQPATLQAAQEAVREMDGRLHNERLLGGLPALEQAPLRRQRDALVETWDREIRPLALAAIAEATLRPQLISRVDAYVPQVDRFVQALETELETNVQWQRAWLGMALFLGAALIVIAIFLLNLEVFHPLSELLRSARAVRTGSFKSRVEISGPDEMGQLAQSFNSMIEQLGRLYGSLEKQVTEKTAELERRNRSLALLYDTTHTLAGKPLDASVLHSVLERLKQELGVEGGVICSRHLENHRGIPIVREEAVYGDLCLPERCAQCLNSGELTWQLETTGRGERRVVNIPLVDGGVVHGVMPLALPPGKGLEAWQLDLAQTIGRHLGAALAAAERRDEHQRLALLEERSAIARELHDSLAQSLSYTKIQLLRLGSMINDDKSPSSQAARAVLEELREGVAASYRQLRELLTTFRLKIGSEGLAIALRQVIGEFEKRSGVTVEVDDELVGAELSANEQIHVLQIVREALTNIEKHAQARHCRVALLNEDQRRICVLIEDDGIGIGAASPGRDHYGLSIMRDRAALLGGELQVGPGERGGTRVQLRFVAATAFAVNPPPAVAADAEVRTL